jgi:alkanesulfonate monooxygenase SsuD/methylene tetrahydromethanopterin reductase-like flavin-dependent oxidoreductase (luciferase family)
MAERLGLAIIPGTGWSTSEIQTVAHEAEEAEFDAIFTAEVNNDALATAQLMGVATHRILVGTWVANIYLRHPYVCAQGAALIADATGGRFVLGLGVSHQPVNGDWRSTCPTHRWHCGVTLLRYSTGSGARGRPRISPSGLLHILCPST